MKRRLIKEGTGNFDIENRCVVVMYEPDEEYDNERRQEYLENNPDATEEEVEDYISRGHELDAEMYYEDFQRDFDNADKPEGYFYEIKLKPGYYEGGSIDICEKGSYDPVSDYVMCDVIDFLNDDDSDIKGTIDERIEEYAGFASPEAKERLAEEIRSRLTKKETDEGEAEYGIRGYNPGIYGNRSTTELVDSLDDIFKEDEYKKMNAWLDKFADEHGLDDYAVSARFSNGETMYSKVDRKKTNESRSRKGRMLKEAFSGIRTVADALENFSSDFDFASNYTDEYEYPTVCPPVELTDAGKAEWKDVLRLPVESVFHSSVHGCYVVVVDINKIPKKRADRAESRLNSFCYALAGYCPESKYNLWFKRER